jgi:hypothetical protein
MGRTKTSARAGIVGVAGLALAAPVALGQEWDQDERMHDPPASWLPTRTSIPNTGGATDGPGFYLTQVNVTSAGLNILGDAASEPAMAIDPTAPNRIVISWRQFDNVISDFRQAGHAWSNDGGRTWHNTGVLTPGTFRSDPVVEADAEGHFYILDIQNAPYCSDTFRSADGGESWGEPIPAFGGDKEWMAIDRTNGSGHGFMYETWSSSAACVPGSFSRSTDAGASWMVPIGGTYQWGTLDVASNGTLFATGVGSTTFPVLRSTNASNGSVTPIFSTAMVNLDGGSLFGATPNPGGLGGQPWVAVDRSGGPRDGWVYLLCSVRRTGGSDPADVMFNRSTDGGVTWLATPIRVNNDAPGNYQWFGTMSVAPNGRIDVIWNDTRDSQNPIISRVYYAWSNDGGDTWLGNIPVTQYFNSTVGWPGGNDKIGDYYQLRSDRVGASLAFAATFNNEQDVYFLRINEWDCNGNGVPDSLDIANGTEQDCNHNGIPDSCERAAGVNVVCACYANCDASTSPPVLNVQDFTCFLQRFQAGDLYANCDNSVRPPVLNVQDFTCFLQKFGQGCP